MELWQKSIKVFNLSLNEDDVYNTLKSLRTEFGDKYTDNYLFFIYIKNKIGGQLMDISEEHADLLAWVDIVKKAGHTDWYMFVFQEQEDYLLYESFYNSIKDNVDKELLDIFNNSCPQWIQSINSIN